MNLSLLSPQSLAFPPISPLSYKERRAQETISKLYLLVVRVIRCQTNFLITYQWVNGCKLLYEKIRITVDK